jgi:PAS domain S-box-containing protein
LTEGAKTDDKRLIGLEEKMEATTRKEDTLAQQAWMLENILQHAADGICVCHNIPEAPHVRFTHWNPQMTAITGYTLEEINRLGWRQTMYPDPEVQKRAIERMARMRTGDDIRAEEWTITRKDGEKRCLSISTSIITEEDEKVHVLAMMHDVSEGKQFEEELRSKEALLEGVLNGLKDIVGIQLPDHTMIRYNKAGYDLLGLSPSEVTGRKCYELIGRDKPCDICATRDVVETKQIQTVENFVPELGRHFLCTSNPILRPDGDIQLIVEQLTDITERVKAEEALREKEAFVQDIIRSMRDGVFVLNDRFQYVIWNPAMEAISEVPKEKVVFQEKKPWELFPHLREVGIDHVMKRAMGGEILLNREVPYYLPRGKAGFTSESYFPLQDSEGAITGVIGVIRDISERVEMERQIRQLEKADSLGRMAGAIAHHFNNQLQAVMGYLELAMGDLPRAAGPAEALTEAMAAARRAATVSGQMITYLGLIPSTRGPVDLSEACRLSLPLIEAAMPKNIVLETDLPVPGPAILADASQMREVLTHLVTNAWEAMGDSEGVIRLSVKTAPAGDIPKTHRFPIDWHPGENAYACLEVKDSGPGIAQQDMEKLFDPFFSSKFTGRGMGLPVVLGIVRAHGGCITVESRGRAGSRERGGVRTEIRGQKSEFRGQKTGGGGQRREDEDQRREGGGQRREDGDQRSEVRSQKKENLGELVYPVAPEDGTGASWRENPVGMMFRVFIPLFTEDVVRPVEKAARAPELKGSGTVLVIEDDPQVRGLAVAVLSRMGFTVLQAKDGVEGVEIFREHQDEIRFVLSDLTMPRMDGWQTIAALRKIDPNIPIILASGYDEASVMSGDHAEWPQAFLGKPYSLEELRKAIGEVTADKAKPLRAGNGQL